MSESARNLIEAFIAMSAPLIALGTWLVLRSFNMEKKLAVLEEKMGNGFEKIRSMLAERRR
jgi:hypothetical protein